MVHDDRGGRERGSEGHRAAPRYVAKEFKRAGLEPISENGSFLQPVPLVSRLVEKEASSVQLRLPDRILSLDIGEDIVLLPAGRSGRSVTADLVFGGYGIEIPSTDYSDFEDLAVESAVVLSVFGWPRYTPQPAAAYGALFDGQRAALRRHGARGVFTTVPQPWEKTKTQFGELDMDLADPDLALFRDVDLWGFVNPKVASWLLGAQEWELVAGKLRRGEDLRAFPVDGEINAKVVFQDRRLQSENIIGLAPAGGHKETPEYVVLVAHLDGYGTDQSGSGDTIFNGAMDNAAGVTTLIEAARCIAEQPEPLERSILFLITTAEEKGMLGARFFLASGAIPSKDIAAVLTVDTPLPLRPLTEVWGWGLADAGLGPVAEQTAVRLGLSVNANPPGPSLFAMGDQLVFALDGHSSALVGFGYSTQDAGVRREFFANRSHTPRDELNAGVDFEAAAEFSCYVADLAVRIANSAQTPEWAHGSMFRKR